MEDDDPFRELQDDIEADFDATTFADVDAEVIALRPPPSDADDWCSDDDDDYSDEVADEPVKCPDKNKLLQVIKTLHKFSLFLDKGDTIQSYVSHIESQVN